MTMLQGLAGEWEGEEDIATTRWGQGGAARGFIQTRSAAAGKLLVQDYRQERDGKTTLEAHAVFTTGPEHDGYGLYWYDSYGFVPAAPAPGVWDGQRLVFIRSSSRGQTRHVYTFEGDDAFTLRLESSFDGGVSWERVMDGRYRRVGP